MVFAGSILSSMTVAAFLGASDLLSPCRRSKIVTPSGEEITAYIATQNPEARGALILPGTGGELFTDRWLASRLCRAGLNAYVLNYSQDEADPEDLKSHDRISRKVMTEISAFLKIGPPEVVILGSSLGGLYASIAYGLSLTDSPAKWESLSRIKGLVMIASGGSLAEVLAHSELKSVRRQREKRMAYFSWDSKAAYVRQLNPKVKLDPLKLAQATQKESVLMVIGTQDDSVPSFTQENLWKAWGEPERLNEDHGHALTILKSAYSQAEKIAEFSESLFKNKN